MWGKKATDCHKNSASEHGCRSWSILDIDNAHHMYLHFQNYIILLQYRVFYNFFLRVLVSVTKILVSEKRSPCCSRGGCWDPSELETPSILCSFSTQSRSPDPECWKLRTLGREIIQNPKSSKYKICGNSFYLSPLKLLSEGVIWEIPGEVDLICRQRESRKKKNISTHHPVSSINAMVILL